MSYYLSVNLQSDRRQIFKGAVYKSIKVRSRGCAPKVLAALIVLHIATNEHLKRV